MEQRYNISGTYEELKGILEKEFKITSDKARILTVVLVSDQNQEQNQLQLEEEALWFLNGNKENYQSHIFSTRYTITFSKAMLDVLDEVLVPVILDVSGLEKMAVCSGFLLGIKALVKNVRRIKDNECCVYYNILQYLKNRSERWIPVGQAIPNVDANAICVNLDKSWNCKYRCGETCKINSENVKDILEKFCEDGVMVSNDEKTLYKFTV